MQPLSGRFAGGHARGNPLAGRAFPLDPDHPAHRTAELWRASRPADAAIIERLAGQPAATWFGDWSEDVAGEAAHQVSLAVGAGTIPVLVAYAIPGRDVGGHSSGGLRSAAGYRRWITALAHGIGPAHCAVVLEPDALAMLEQLPAAAARERVALLAEAVRVLSGQANTSVYLDAGHSAWQPPAVIAERLRAAGIAAARGFALNVSNFRATADELAYGRRIGRLLGSRVPFVIDTGRNGAGPAPDGEWCNPPGRALGERPSAATGHPDVDAFLWIKPPGMSDGPCNGGPAAGTWWPEYALGLARRSGWASGRAARS